MVQLKHIGAIKGCGNPHVHRNRRHQTTTNCLGVELIGDINQKRNLLLCARHRHRDCIATPTRCIFKLLQKRIGRVFGNRAAGKTRLCDFFSIRRFIGRRIPAARGLWGHVGNINLWRNRVRPCQIGEHHLQRGHKAGNITRFRDLNLGRGITLGSLGILG